MSHTVRVVVQLQNKEALAASVRALEGTVLGDGSHRLYAGAENGFGFTLLDWRFPLVLKEDGTLAFDDFHGSWGNVADISRLRERYALEAARQAASAQGWFSEMVQDGLLIHHPDGGSLKVLRDGTVDAIGFVGQSCAGATEAIEMALGKRQDATVKDEFFAERARVNVGG